MIKSNKALSMAEAREFLDEEQSEVNAFMKGFTELDIEQAKELREKLLALDMIKLNEKHISKIIDILPEDKDDLGKILTDVSVDENEAKNILDTIKEYK
ncbi:MAG: hypothetical protein PF542_05310 [Nanoarchaeota archaeon]|jgi:DNA-directed RNA polymerase subunit F|nr:hypothetical protein [Nanoarchaeota archaeon]